MYPESVPENWKEMLEDLCVPAFVSPLHDQDVEETGEKKKAHWHVMLMFSGVQTQEKVKEIADKFNGALPQGVRDSRTMARYLCHLDQPSKHQYEKSDVLEFGGADYLNMIQSAADRYEIIGDMIDWCDETGILSYASLVRYARKNNRDWFRVLCDNGSYIMKEYLKSTAWESGNDTKKDK